MAAWVSRPRQRCGHPENRRRGFTAAQAATTSWCGQIRMHSAFGNLTIGLLFAAVFVYI
jgi:hypothetical protein